MLSRNSVPAFRADYYKSISRSALILLLFLINNSLLYTKNSSISGSIIPRRHIILQESIPFGEQLLYENTIYEIRNAFDLADTSIEVPIGCTLVLNGGVLKNGGLSLKNSILKLNNGCVFLSKPLILKNSIVIGDGGQVIAQRGYAYPSLIESKWNDEIHGVRIDLQNNPIIGINLVADNSDRREFSSVINDVEIENGGSGYEIAIKSISLNTVCTTRNHGLKTGDMVEFMEVKGGVSKNNPSGSVYNGIFFVEEISSTVFKIYSVRINKEFDKLFSGYTSYSSGGKIKKISCGIAAIESYLSYVRTISASNFTIKGCTLGVYDASSYNSFSHFFIGSCEYSMLFKGSVRGTFVSDGRVDASILCRTGIHGLAFDNISAYMAKDISVVSVVGFNSENGNRGGEVENISFTNCYFNTVAEKNPVIESNGHNFTFENSLVIGRGPHKVSTLVKNTGYRHLYENVTLSEGNWIVNHPESMWSNCVYRKIKTTQSAERGELTIYPTRQYNPDYPSDYAGFTIIDDVSLNVAQSPNKKYNADQIVLKNISGQLDISNLRRAIIVDCPYIIGDNTGNNTIINGKKTAIPAEQVELASSTYKLYPQIGYLTGANTLSKPVLRINRVSVKHCASITVRSNCLGTGIGSIENILFYLEYNREQNIIKVTRQSEYSLSNESKRGKYNIQLRVGDKIISPNEDGTKTTSVTNNRETIVELIMIGAPRERLAVSAEINADASGGVL